MKCDSRTLALLIIAILVTIGLACIIVGDKQAETYCDCLGHQPYINTKWNGSDCLTLVLDIDNYYDGEALVEYLYSSMEYCR